jgi:hypothetical protein
MLRKAHHNFGEISGWEKTHLDTDIGQTRARGVPVFAPQAQHLISVHDGPKFAIANKPQYDVKINTAIKTCHVGGCENIEIL